MCGKNQAETYVRPTVITVLALIAKYKDKQLPFFDELWVLDPRQRSGMSLDLSSYKNVFDASLYMVMPDLADCSNTALTLPVPSTVVQGSFRIIMKGLLTADRRSMSHGTQIGYLLAMANGYVNNRIPQLGPCLALQFVPLGILSSSYVAECNDLWCPVRVLCLQLCPMHIIFESKV